MIEYCFSIDRRAKVRYIFLHHHAVGKEERCGSHAYGNQDRYVRWFTEHCNIVVPWLGPSLMPRHALTVDRLRRRIVIRSLHEHDIPRMGRLTFLTLTHARLKMTHSHVGSPDMAGQHDHAATQLRLAWSNGRPVESNSAHEGRKSWVAA